MKILFASQNKGKTKEVQSILSDFEIINLNDFGYTQDIIEDGDTFKANAQIKVDALRKLTDLPILSDDSGLVVPILNNEPGIHSARYAGTGKSEDNIAKLLTELKQKPNRKAYFITVLCYFDGTDYFFFEGKLQGEITLEPSGNKGFGYDPIFKPNNFGITLADMEASGKNQISHRSAALKLFKEFLLN